MLDLWLVKVLGKPSRRLRSEGWDAQDIVRAAGCAQLMAELESETPEM